MPSGVYIRTKRWKVKDSSRMGVKKGTKLSDAHKKKIRNTQKRNYASGKIVVPSQFMLGKHHTAKWNDNISKSMRGKPHSKIHIKRIKDARAKQIFPVKDTSIEVKIQEFLTALHIEFFTHKYMKIEHGYQCDIFIPEQKGFPQKIIIEADGCYWHGCLICNKNDGGLNELQNKQIQEDGIRTKELIEKGFKVIRIWEHDIKKISIRQFEDKLK